MSNWAARVYNADKRAAELCCEMAITGFAFDRARALELSAALRDEETRLRAEAEAAVGRHLRRTKTGGFGQQDLHDAFFEDLQAPVFWRSALTGRPSLGVDSMRAYAACADERLQRLALALLGWRRARKVRVTYLDNVPIGRDGRIHPTWLNYGAVSGRFSCQQPNLMNLPRPENDPTFAIVKGGIRSCYIAKPGYALVGADAKQLEMRVAAYASGDAAMIAACNSSDLHAANAAVIFGEAFQNASGGERAALRTLAKSAGFAVCYMAEAETVYVRIVASGVSVQLRQVEAMLRRLRRGFARYYSWQSERLLDCVRDGFTDTPLLGRRRYLGHDPSPTECANFPIQGGAADLMNLRLPDIVSHLREASPSTRLVAQVHDAMYFEAPEDEADKVASVMREVFEAPIVIDSSGEPLTASFPIDVEVSERWH